MPALAVYQAAARKGGDRQGAIACHVSVSAVSWKARDSSTVAALYGCNAKALTGESVSGLPFLERAVALNHVDGLESRGLIIRPSPQMRKIRHIGG